MSTSIKGIMFTGNQGIIVYCGMTFQSNGNGLICIQESQISQQLFNNAQQTGGKQRAAEIFCMLSVYSLFILYQSMQINV